MALTVLITGASQGIGKAIAQLFAKNQYNLVLAARQPERLIAFAQELQQAGHTALAVPTDVREAQQVNDLVEKALATFGTIDVLVNNAGIYISGPAEEFTLDDWHQAIDTNLWGYIHTIHALLPHFVERGRGTIVNVASVGSKVPIPYLVPYSTSKFAIAGLTQSLHSELSPKGIHVCGIYPNLIRSHFLERAIFRGKNPEDAQMRHNQVAEILQNPFVETPKDVAKAVWEGVQHQKAEVVVGSANLSVVADRTMPALLQWIMRRTFKNKDEF